MRGSHVITFFVNVLSVIDRATFVCLFWVVVRSVTPLWVLPYLYPTRQGWLVWEVVLAPCLATGRGRAGS